MKNSFQNNESLPDAGIIQIEPETERGIRAGMDDGLADRKRIDVVILHDVRFAVLVDLSAGADVRVIGGDPAVLAVELFEEFPAAAVVQAETDRGRKTGQQAGRAVLPICVINLGDVLGTDDKARAKAPAEIDAVVNMLQVRRFLRCAPGRELP